MPFTTPSSFRPQLEAPTAGDRLWFVFQGRRLLVTDDLAVPRGGPDLLGLDPGDVHVLGMLDDVPCVTAHLRGDATVPDDLQARDLRSLFARLPAPLMAVAGRAVQVVDWDRTHRFCGVCGAPTEAAGDRRARVCTACGHQAFPRLAPAIIVAVEREDTLLLARSPRFPPGIHSTVAGFVDPGESAEEAVAREVREETGIEVRDIRYFASQPWPFPHSLMLGFQAHYASGEVTVDGEEIVSADFFRHDAMPPVFPGRVSISQWLIRDFLLRYSPDFGTRKQEGR